RPVDLGPATLLRYRFDDVAQTRAHLIASERSTLLFFRDRELRAGTPVLVELAFRGTEQTRLLRGSALAVAAGGTWLEFPQRDRLEQLAGRRPLLRARGRCLPRVGRHALRGAAEGLARRARIDPSARMLPGRAAPRSSAALVVDGRVPKRLTVDHGEIIHFA